MSILDFIVLLSQLLGIPFQPPEPPKPEPVVITEVRYVQPAPPTPKPQPAPTQRAVFVSGGSVWDRLADCETDGGINGRANWASNTGNGYYGGLQFDLRTWRGNGGTGYPHQVSREQQIAVAERVRAARGYNPWPACADKLGLR